MISKYLNPTDEERLEWVNGYVRDHKHSYNGKESLRKYAKKQWRLKVRRAKLRKKDYDMQQSLSNETILFLSDLLNQVTLNVSAGNFEEVALQTVQAKREVTKALSGIKSEEESNLLPPAE
jgi:hypothetical protein